MRVPQAQRQIFRQGLYNVQGINADAFGGTQARQIGQLAQPIQSFANNVSQYATIIKQRDKQILDSSTVRHQLNLAREQIRDYTTGDLYQRQGIKATNIYDEAKEKISAIKRNVTKDIMDPRQREMFDASFNSIEQGHLDQILGYQEQATIKYERDTTNAENYNAVQDAVAARNDPELIKEAEWTVMVNTAYLNKDQSPEVKRAAVDQAVHNLHSSVVEALVEDDPLKAHEYVKANRDKFNPKVLAQLEASLQDQVDKVEVRQTALNIKTVGGTLDVQLAAVDKIKDPDKAKAVRALVKEYFNETQTAINIAKAKRTEEVWDQIFAKPGETEVPTDLDAAVESQMRAYKAEVRKAAEAAAGIGDKSMTDWGLYSSIKNLPPEDFIKVNLPEYITRLNPTEFKELVNDQKTTRASMSSKSETLAEKAKTAATKAKQDAIARSRTLNAQIDDYVKGNSDFDLEDDDGRKRYNQFREQADLAIKGMPVDDRENEAKVGVVLNRLLERHDPWGFGDYYKFEQPYLTGNAKKKLNRQIIPESLRSYGSSVNYDATSGTFYRDTKEGIRYFYDAEGNQTGKATK